MRTSRVDHVNISGTMQTLQRCVEFYSEVLGLAVGDRPPFASRGFWLYAGEAAIVHLTETASDGVATEGPLNHVAFACQDVDAVRAALAKLGVPFTEARVPGGRQVQVFVRDPAGVQIELNFAAG